MLKVLKEIFITFIALYMLVISLGVFNAFNFILTEKNITQAPSCDIGRSGKPCTCSCNMEFARECCCCSVDSERPEQAANNRYIIVSSSCNDLPTMQSSFIALKFVLTGKTGYELYPSEKEYFSVKSNQDQSFISSIDHPPSIVL